MLPWGTAEHITSIHGAHPISSSSWACTGIFLSLSPGMSFHHICHVCPGLLSLFSRKHESQISFMAYFFLSVIHRACQPFIVFIIIEKILSLGPSGVLLLNNIAFNTYQPRSGCKLALRLKQTSISWPNSVKSAYLSIVRSICYGLLVRSVYFNWQRYTLVFKSTLVIPNCNASYCPVLVNSCF